MIEVTTTSALWFSVGMVSLMLAAYNLGRWSGGDEINNIWKKNFREEADKYINEKVEERVSALLKAIDKVDQDGKHNG